MSRLDFAPRVKEIEITDVKSGLCVFTPKPDKSVSFAALKDELKHAGYKLASAEITAAGTLRRDAAGWWLVVEPTGQRFLLEGGQVKKLAGDFEPGARVEVAGDWKTAGKGSSAREVLAPASAKNDEGPPAKDKEKDKDDDVEGDPVEDISIDEETAVFSGSIFTTTSLELSDSMTHRGGAEDAETARRVEPFRPASSEAVNPPRPLCALCASAVNSYARNAQQKVDHTQEKVVHAASSANAFLKSLAPIRTTSPGLTVYRGGAFVPRLTYTRQRLGELEVTRQTLSLAASYTPTPRLQLEAEIPISRSSFDDGVRAGSGAGIGNVAVRGKYRFYRSVEEWGDRQAAVRLGLELPTGKASAPGESKLNAPAFVRQQLTPISGGLAATLDVAYSQARGRVIYGANAEGVLRAGRDGFHTGHELHVNTDLEYIVFPFSYRRPTGEIFAILETNYVRRGRGRLSGAEVAESGATEFYFAPALQYVATTRLVVEGGVQIPVFRRTGAQLLRNGGGLLVGLRYLF